MSYDFLIQGDDTFSVETALEPLQQFIRTIPGVMECSARGFEWGDGEQYLMLGYLEFVDEEGDSIEGEGGNAGRVNCINASIASAFISPQKLPHYLQVCIRIGEYLGWQVWDCQTDECLPDGRWHA